MVSPSKFWRHNKEYYGIFEKGLLPCKNQLLLLTPYLSQVFERVFLGGKKTYHTKHSRERIEEHLWDRFHFRISISCELLTLFVNCGHFFLHHNLS